jgi:sec-independent protein translocase protein TatC
MILYEGSIIAVGIVEKNAAKAAAKAGAATGTDVTPAE